MNKKSIKFETLHKKLNIKNIVIGVLFISIITLVIVSRVSHAAFTSNLSVPLVNGKINYKHPDFKIVNMYVKSTDGYTEVNTMPSGDEYKINESKSYCNKGFTEEKDTNAVLKTVNGNHVMNNLTKNDRCVLYFDPLPILANNWFSKQGTDNAITKPDVESITSLDKISIPSTAIESWDASEKGNGTVMAYYTDTDSNGLYEVYIAGDGSLFAPTYSAYLFSDSSYSGAFRNVTQIDLSKLNTSNVMSMRCMFYYMDSLTSLDITNFDTSNVIDMSYMFRYLISLTSLNVSHFDTSNVTNMREMFSGMSKITSLDVSNFNTSKVTNMSSMFYNNQKLASLDVSHFDTSNVIDMSYMFHYLISLTSLNVSHFDTSNVTNMREMFSGMSKITSLDVSHFDTSEVTNMRNMFNGMKGLASIDVSNFDTSKVTDMGNMFAFMSSLKNLNISNFDTREVTNMREMFR